MTVTTVPKSATCGGGHHCIPRRQSPQRSAPLQWLHHWPEPNDGVPRNATGPCSLGLTIAATSLGFVMVQLDVSILNVALARIGEAVATDIAGLQWVVDAYAIAFASLLLAAGALGDRFGARRVYISGFVVFVLASLGCGLAPGAGALIAARAAQGVGAALLVPCSLALLTHACGDDGAARARAVSLWTAAASVALSAGPVLGGLLVDTLGWRSIFLLNIPVGAAGIWLTRRFITDTTPSNGGLDPVGQALALLMLLALIGAVIEAGRLGLGPLVLSGFGIAVLSGAAFAAVEARSPDPMLPLSFFREPAFSATTLVGLLINLTLYGAIFVLSLYLQQVRGYSPMAAGLAFLPFPVVLGMANVAAGWVGSWAGLRLPMAFGLLVAGVWFLAAAAPRRDIVVRVHSGWHDRHSRRHRAGGSPDDIGAAFERSAISRGDRLGRAQHGAAGGRRHGCRSVRGADGQTRPAGRSDRPHGRDRSAGLRRSHRGAWSAATPGQCQLIRLQGCHADHHHSIIPER